VADILWNKETSMVTAMLDIIISMQGGQALQVEPHPIKTTN
jgi:hypothetical protein